MTLGSLLSTKFLAGKAAYRITISLIYTLWQGAAIGTIALVCVQLLRLRTAHTRHLV